MGKKGPLWWRESDWLLRGSSAANQILLRHSGPILSHTDDRYSSHLVSGLLSFNFVEAICSPYQLKALDGLRRNFQRSSNLFYSSALLLSRLTIQLFTAVQVKITMELRPSCVLLSVLLYFWKPQL